MKNYLYLFVVSSFLLSSTAFAKNCQEVRLGLDIGSGSTKMMVAKVDFCKKKIMEVLYNESRPVSYNEDLEKNADGNLSPAIVEKGLLALTEMTAKAKPFKPKKSYGVATSVFRKSKNGSDVIKGFAKKLKIHLEVIDQEKEALLGYLSVMSLMDEKEIGPKNMVVWDIGGGSMQMFSQDEGKKAQKYLGDLASVTFKNMVIEVLENKKLESTTTPNPIGDKREQAIALARSYARIHVPADLKAEIHERVVVGVGGVHGHSIRGQLQTKEMKYTLEELDKASKVQAQKSDSELTGDYRSTDVTNLLLVQGFMEGLGIKEVKIVNATLLQGVLLN